MLGECKHSLPQKGIPHETYSHKSCTHLSFANSLRTGHRRDYHTDCHLGSLAVVTTAPTQIPMPTDWMEIAETRQIGGRQVPINAAGVAATEQSISECGAKLKPRCASPEQSV